MSLKPAAPVTAAVLLLREVLREERLQGVEGDQIRAVVEVDVAGAPERRSHDTGEGFPVGTPIVKDFFVLGRAR